MKKIVKIILSFLADTCGLIDLKHFFFIRRNKKLCLMYHRVLPSMQANACEPGMYVTPQVFDMHLGQLVKRFHLCSLQEMCQVASLEKFKHTVKPLCSLTFDDGWRDFYQFVFPLLVKYSIPATIFLPTFFIGTKKRFWQDSVITIADSLVGTEKVSVSKFEFCSVLAKDIYCLLSGGDGIDTAIEILKKEKLNIISCVLDDLYKMIPVKSQVIDERDFLSWDEIQEMKGSGLVQFGSHTHTHQILTTLEPDDVRCELEISKTILLDRGLVDPLFVPFCYPNGNYNDEIIGMVREAGYHMAVTTKRGWYLKGDSLFTIKRIGIHNDISYTVGLFLSRILGIL